MRRLRQWRLWLHRSSCGGFVWDEEQGVALIYCRHWRKRWHGDYAPRRVG